MRSVSAITYCRDWREGGQRANDRSATTRLLRILALTAQAATRRRSNMSTLSIGLALAIRIVLVLLFLPFSALDKVLDFRGAVTQAQEAVSNKAAATALILVGLFVEVF